MFEVAGRLAPNTDDPTAVQLAIWFHDAVYDPRASDNETRSADLAVDLLSSIGVPGSVIEKVVRLVRATAHLSSGVPPTDRDTATLLDADLAILGSSPARYQRYAADIRKEYAWLAPSRIPQRSDRRVKAVPGSPTNLLPPTNLPTVRGACQAQSNNRITTIG
jgi:predicted metal-dependent HD superfamily phosphohydrolase